MSTWTPSPVASPSSTAFHIRSSRPFAAAGPPSPRQSPRSTRSAFNAPPSSSPPSSSRAAAPRSGTTSATPAVAESGPIIEIDEPRYVSRGTQYSPGPNQSPPTSRRSLRTVAPAIVDTPPSAVVESARKRKEASRSPSPPPSMSTASGTASGSVSAPPNEPQPRVEPTEALPQRILNNDPTADLQEARSTHGHSSAPKRSRPDPESVKTMPLKYETCNPKDLGVLISHMLMELIRLNDQIPLRDGRLTRFHSRAPPGISVSDYLQRLVQHATLSPPILLSMVYYIDRLCAMYTPFTINSLTVHRFLITAATVAAKGLSDSFWTNPTYARIGGIPVSELATLELELLQKVQWKIVPKPEVLEDYYRSLVDRTQGFELEESLVSSASSIDESPSLDRGTDHDAAMAEG